MSNERAWKNRFLKESETSMDDIIRDFDDLKRSLYKEYPAMSNDRRYIKAAKIIASKYKIKYQDILKKYTPSRNFSGEKYWDSNGNII